MGEPLGSKIDVTPEMIAAGLVVDCVLRPPDLERLAEMAADGIDLDGTGSLPLTRQAAGERLARAFVGLLLDLQREQQRSQG